MFTIDRKRVLFVKCCVFLTFIPASGSDRVKRGFCSIRNLDIKNGSYRLRSGNSVADFTCNTGFILYGAERIVCFTSRWSSDPPMCIANTCRAVPSTSTLKIEKEYEGALLKFSCAVLYKLDGAEQIICDGKYWNAAVPTCQPWNPPLTCDFEDSELCGWSHHDTDDQDWRWNTGKTSTSRTGPSHDHTLGDGGNGHYMYFETSSPTRTHHNAVLKSPLYPADYSTQKCFIFWYHILGEGDISDLEVFIKPESEEDLSKLTRIFHTNTDGGDVWYEESSQIPPQTQPFQVLLVATRATNYRSDIAIDDVAIGDCAGTLPPVVFTTEVSASTTRRRPTNVPVSSTQVASMTSEETRPPSTQTPSTTTTAIKTTLKPTPVATTQPTTKKTTRLSTVNPSTVKVDTTVSEVSQTFPSTNKQTLPPKINPNLQPSRTKRVPGEAKGGPSIIWIVLGAALVLVIAIGGLFGVYLFRRNRKNSRTIDSLSSSNPLYTAVNGDEAAVHFAADDGLGDF